MNEQVYCSLIVDTYQLIYIVLHSIFLIECNAIYKQLRAEFQVNNFTEMIP